MATKKKDVPAVIKAAGVVAELVSAIFRAVFRVGGTAEDIYRLVTPDGGATIEKIAALIVQASKPARATAASYLEFVGTIMASGRPRFVAANRFKIDTSAEAEVSIGYMDDNFRRVMVPKLEAHIPSAELAIHRLTRDSLDVDIRAELTPQTETTALLYLWTLLTKQGHGQTGALLTNGFANVFYILGTDGNLWAVSACWRVGRGYWVVFAYSVTGPSRWYEGRLVFSRKC